MVKKKISSHETTNSMIATDDSGDIDIPKKDAVMSDKNTSDKDTEEMSLSNTDATEYDAYEKITIEESDEVQVEEPDPEMVAEAEQMMINMSKLAADQVSEVDDEAEIFNRDEDLWLEIDGDTIIGIHNYQCQSELKWIKYEGDAEVSPGDTYKNGKIISSKVEPAVEDIKSAATGYIVKFYPTWKQLNVLREGDKQDIEKMSRFIDSVRAWTRKPKAKIEDLEKILP